MRLLADDLTGALDSAAQFTGRLGPVPVDLDLPARSRVGHGALDAATRDVSQPEAVAAMARLGGFLGTGCAFKKVDSLLRGHWVAELTALLEAGGFASVVLAPAFPDQGRLTRRGYQVVEGLVGTAPPLAIDVVSALRNGGLTAHVVPRSEIGTVAGPGTVLVADAEDAADLDAIAAWGDALPEPTLWVGSAGLARALAGAAPRRDAAVAKPLLGLIGSAHPVMGAQVARVRGLTDAVLCPVSEDVPSTARGIARAVEEGRSALATFVLPDGIAARDAAEQIAARIAILLPIIPRFPTLVIAGGETLRAVCVASGAERLVVESEYGPGVPRSRIVGGRWDGQAVISKSGAFGTPEFLVALLS